MAYGVTRLKAWPKPVRPERQANEVAARKPDAPAAAQKPPRRPRKPKE